MPIEKEYIEYAVTLILSVLGISSTYLIDFENPITLLSLIFLPILYGHTAYISRDKFNQASLLSLFTLLFSVVGGLTAVMTVFYGIGNILVSAFAGGKRTKDYYESVSIPLLITGLIVGITIFGYTTINQDFKNTQTEKTSQQLNKITQKTLEETKFFQKQEKQQIKIINQTSRTSVKLTAEKVKNNSQPSEKLTKILENAQTEIPNQIIQEQENQSQNYSQIKSLLNDTIKTKINSLTILIIPLTMITSITVHPLIGILTALSAKTFSKIFS